MDYKEITKATRNATCVLGEEGKVMISLLDIQRLLDIIEEQDKLLSNRKKVIHLLEKQIKELKREAMYQGSMLDEYV